jgi:hypothetical protein
MIRTLMTSLLLFQLLFAQAQMDSIRVKGLLTNQSKREWLFRQIEPTMGSSCVGDGQSFTFYYNGILHWRKCVGDSIVFKQVHWSVRRAAHGIGTWDLVFDSPIPLGDTLATQTVRVDLMTEQMNSPKQKMLWRILATCSDCLEQRIYLISKN